VLVLASVGALLLLFALYYYSQELDSRFYPRSERSFLAFAHYLVGDYAKAARLYRLDLAVGFRGHAPEWWVAFLAGDLPRAEQLVRRELARTPNDPEVLGPGAAGPRWAVPQPS
jgi:hypothetical protein